MGISNTFPNPLQINLGEGRYEISTFQSKVDDSQGILFFDTGKPHEIGKPTGTKPDHNHLPISGEVYIRCANIESAKALQQQINKLVLELDGFKVVDVLGGEEKA